MKGSCESLALCSLLLFLVKPIKMHLRGQTARRGRRHGPAMSIRRKRSSARATSRPISKDAGRRRKGLIKGRILRQSRIRLGRPYPEEAAVQAIGLQDSRALWAVYAFKTSSSNCWLLGVMRWGATWSTLSANEGCVSKLAQIQQPRPFAGALCRSLPCRERCSLLSAARSGTGLREQRTPPVARCVDIFFVILVSSWSTRPADGPADLVRPGSFVADRIDCIVPA